MRITKTINVDLVKSEEKTSIFAVTKKRLVITIAVFLITVLCCTLPMGLSPTYNGSVENHRNQYEKMAEALLAGHFYLDCDVDQKLLDMENPYDNEARKELGVNAYWDHSFYNGKYYMYFGIVPVILLFLPFRLITGVSLLSYHATQIFVAFYILGVFLLFALLEKKLFSRLPFIMYILLSVSVSVMSIWLAVDAPALYCTALTAAICMMIWCFYFWAKAFYEDNRERKSIWYGILGSLFGALAFGCRPPVALANILILIVFIYYAKKRKGSIVKCFVTLIPYAVVGILLMLYNYVRFGSVFEFGQSYQLTYYDMTGTNSILSIHSLTDLIHCVSTIINRFIDYLFFVNTSGDITANGVFISFPILWYLVIGLASEDTRSLIKQKKLSFIVGALIISVLLIILVNAIGSPQYYTCRYSLDVIWLLGILAYIIIGVYYKTKNNQKGFSRMVCILSIITVLITVVLFICPHDYNFTSSYGDLETLIISSF